MTCLDPASSRKSVTLGSGRPGASAGPLGASLKERSGSQRPVARGTARTGCSSARERLQEPKRSGLAPKMPHCQTSCLGAWLSTPRSRITRAEPFSSAGPALSASAKVTPSYDTPFNPKPRHRIPRGVTASWKTGPCRHRRSTSSAPGFATRQAAVDDSPRPAGIRDPR